MKAFLPHPSPNYLYTTAVPLSDVPLLCDQHVDSSLSRLGFLSPCSVSIPSPWCSSSLGQTWLGFLSPCSLFIPSPWCSPMTFIVSMSEILSCLRYCLYYYSDETNVPFPSLFLWCCYRCHCVTMCLVLQGPFPSTANGAKWSYVIVIC